MPSSAQSQHARSHALLLLQKLLNLRDSASPLTLVLDTLEQSAKPVVREFMSRAKVSKSKVIFVSFTTLGKPADADIFVRARGKTPEALRAEITSHYPSGQAGRGHKTLVVLDALNPLCSTSPSTLPLLLGSLVPSPAISLVAVYHLDVPVPVPLPLPPHGEYAPPPLSTLSHLATAVLRTSGLPQAAARRRARGRSQQEPGWGLGEGREGVLLGLRGEGGGDPAGGGGLVLEMELRRRSGRAVAEKFVLVPPHPHPHPHPHPPPTAAEAASGTPGRLEKMIASTSRISLLSEHPAFRDRDPGASSSNNSSNGNGGSNGDGEPETTFSLGLTEKQRRDREGIVLPYFDAQEGGVGGGGEGGRILYEMGREDDFDDEEDEI